MPEPWTKALRLALPAAALVAALATLDGCRKETAPEPPRKTPVEVVTVEPTPMADRLALRATVEPWETVQLSAEQAGKLVFAAKEEGDPVAAGERLFGIDKTTYLARVAQARAEAQYRTVSAERSERLYAKNSISKDELDKAVADREVAKAALQATEADLAKTDVFSPIDGLFDEKQAEIGEFLSAGNPLGTVVNTRRVKVIVPVPEKDITYVTPGETMGVAFDALGGDVRQGKVIFVKQVGDRQTLTFPIHLEVDNADGRIRPPMIARVELVRRKIDDAIGVPLFAVVPDVDGYHVFVEDGGVARRRKVTLGFPDGDRWHVTGDLAAGDRLIVRGQRDLTDGDPVKVVPGLGEEPAAASAESGLPEIRPEAAGDAASAAEGSGAGVGP